MHCIDCAVADLFRKAGFDAVLFLAIAFLDPEMCFVGLEHCSAYSEVPWANLVITMNHLYRVTDFSYRSSWN